MPRDAHRMMIRGVDLHEIGGAVHQIGLTSTNILEGKA